MKRWTKGLLLAVVAIMLTACGNGKEEDAAKTDAPLLIGMEAAYPPYNWTQDTDANGAIPIQNSKQFANGYDVSIAKKIGDSLGREVVAVKTDWNGIIPSLQANKVDLVVAGMTPTPERENALLFSDPYYNMEFTIITRKDSPYANAKTIQDLEGARITGQLGTMNYDLLQQIPNAKIEQAMDDYSGMRVALQANRIDAYISEYPEAASATNALQDLTYITPEPNFVVPDDIADYLAIGARKNEQNLINHVNEVLAGISEEERQELMNQAIAGQPSQQ